MRIKHPLNVACQFAALAQHLAQTVSELRQDLLRRGGARNNHRLLGEGREDLLDQMFAHPGRVRPDDLGEFRPAGLTQTSRAAAARQQFRTARPPVWRRLPAATLRRDPPQPSRWSCPYQRSVGATRPGDNTPGSCKRQGQ
ncbi:hypothetical protein GCM10018962_28430 [Dactylosporangium matsuzakiense]|uniref:Uncharacterized protein n=1 Tax=Dactylosporangium matsuzakiense TaxID=53360 RepID=A0A9W6NNG1_9ACTN|nr:hypothetical protein GCM10017581_047240 [Dactylosporangium matsuzakiense]